MAGAAASQSRIASNAALGVCDIHASSSAICLAHPSVSGRRQSRRRASASSATGSRSASAASANCASVQGVSTSPSATASRCSISSQARLKTELSRAPAASNEMPVSTALRIAGESPDICSASHVSHASSRISDAPSSSATAKPGSTPASTGRSRIRSAQKAWIVLTDMPSRSASAPLSAAFRKSDWTFDMPHSTGASPLWRSKTLAASSAMRPLAPATVASFRCDPLEGLSRSSRSTACRSRTFSSPAAFSVNVIAAISRSDARPARRIERMRSTRIVVFPVPAAASTRNVVSRSFVARSRSAWSANRPVAAGWSVMGFPPWC